MDIRVIYEDNHLLVIEKPVNVPSQKDDSHDPDLLTILKNDLKKRYNKPGNVYLGLVHRLDRPVGGVMVFAKTSKAARRLSGQIRFREFDKVYLAVVYGKIQEKSGQLKHYLLKDKSANYVKAVPEPVDGSKEAILDFIVLDAKDEFSLVKVKLHTGRSHQIRVQFSSIGHPLYGDQKYGVVSSKPGEQLALWSAQITLKHPVRDERIAFTSTPPETFPWNLFLETDA